MESALVATAAVSAAAGGGLGHLLTFLTARRQHSGNVETTDADRLWDANEKLLNAYVGDNQRLRERLDEMEARERDCETRYRELEVKDNARAEELRVVKEQMQSLLEAAADDLKTKGASL